MPHPRCTILPLPDFQVSLGIDGRERTRWHFGPNYPRPFLYPLVGPASGLSLTRMGHPGAPDHEHHRSIWFGHEKVAAVNFWADGTAARIRQKGWLVYQDGDDEAVMAVRLGWNDGHDPQDLLEQELLVGIRPGPDGETFLEVQATFRPLAAELELGKTNFGFLGVRVAKAISGFFGGGKLTNSAGANGEAALFGKAAAWVDYSGEQPGGHREGITYFDHPGNVGHPNRWHVREDGWMAASVCMTAPIPVSKQRPLILRYLLHAHNGPLDVDRAAAVFMDFSRRTPWEVVKAGVRHTAYAVRRKS